MAVLFGYLPQNIETKQRPLPHRRNAPTVVPEERHCVMSIDDTSCAGFDYRAVESLVIHKRMPVSAELKINQLQPVVRDQTIVGTRVMMKICEEGAGFGQIFGHDL